MPQLDVFTWLNQVFFLLIMLFMFYYVISFCYLNLTMRLFKTRAKLLIYRNWIKSIFILNAVSMYAMFIHYFLNLLTHNVYLTMLFNQFATINHIKTWVFNSTTIAADLECFYLIQEQLAVANNLNIK